MSLDLTLVATQSGGKQQHAHFTHTDVQTGAQGGHMTLPKG